MYKKYLVLNNQQWLICHETKPNQTKQPRRVRVNFEVMAMKRYSTLHRSPELELNHQDPFLCVWWSNSSAKGYSQRILTRVLVLSRKPSRKVKVKLATIVEGDPKAPFPIATTPRCRGGRFSFPWIAPLYP